MRTIVKFTFTPEEVIEALFLFLEQKKGRDANTLSADPYPKALTLTCTVDEVPEKKGKSR